MSRTFLIISFACVMIFPLFAKAAAPLGFGGYNTWTVPCTCSGGTVWYTWYLPLVPWDPVAGGAMAVGIEGTAMWYSNYDPLVPTTWSLGKFIPGVQTCYQPAYPTGCILWPTIGYAYMLGSSGPGATP